jgi:very-long-chain (3R)-3-hydroxyacyl-CoA dehydratase
MDETHSSPLFTTMLLAWSLTEVIRYTYYATSLLGIKIRALDWLRYTTFLPLYPLGAASLPDTLLRIFRHLFGP